MSYIYPNYNTLIIEIGSFQAKIGYAGDFHPTYFVDFTPKSNELDIISDFVKKTSCDSIIYVEPDNFLLETKIKILNFVFSNKIAESITFLNCRVAEAFGSGKITACILSCSSSKLCTSVVLNGKLIEHDEFGGGINFLKNEILKLISHSLSSSEETASPGNISESYDDIAFQTLFESIENIREFEKKYKIDIFNILKSNLIKCVEKIKESRTNNCINKKNTANGCIILTGGLIRYDPFYQFVSSLLLDKIGEDFSDFILRDKDLINSFAGASLFGMNNETKTMFITASDWESCGSEICKLKSY
jgi:actin-related protein